MSETLRQKQSRFMRLLPRLIDYAYAQGYELTAGELWRTPEQCALNAKTGKGILQSLHAERLAIDVNLFKDGKNLTDTESFRELGEYWESIGVDCCWGGRFRDGGHFSISHGGRK